MSAKLERDPAQLSQEANNRGRQRVVIPQDKATKIPSKYQIYRIQALDCVLSSGSQNL